ncbi:M14 family zinc carboxypeptidase [Virgibacillus oceani]
MEGNMLEKNKKTSFDPSEWTSHRQLRKRVNEMKENSLGRIKVTTLGTSFQGREIYAARVGTGKKVLLLTSEMDGKQKFGTEVLLSLLDALSTDRSGKNEALLEQLTIVAVPKLNPDGSELVQKQNEISWEEITEIYPQLKGTDPCWYYKGNGLELNRDFHADFNYEPRAEDLPGDSSEFGLMLTNEARIIRDLYVSLLAEFDEVEAYVDLRQMGGNFSPVNYINGTDQLVTIALNYPSLGKDGNERYAKDWPKLDQDKSRRYAMAAVKGVMENADAELRKGLAQFYHPIDQDMPGLFGSALALHGSASVLIEIPGQQPDYPKDEKLLELMDYALWGIIQNMADGTVDDLDGNEYYSLPKYW